MDFETVVTKLIKRDRHWCNIPNIAPQESLFINAPIHRPGRPLSPIRKNEETEEHRALFPIEEGKGLIKPNDLTPAAAATTIRTDDDLL